MNGLQAFRNIRKDSRFGTDHGFHFMSGKALILLHDAQTIMEELFELFCGIFDAGNNRFFFRTDSDQFVQRKRQFFFDQHAKNAEGVSAQGERIFFSGRQLSDAEESGQCLNFVGQGNSQAFRCGRKLVTGIARLIVLTNRKSDFVVFFVVMSVVLTHDALQFGELSDHQSA